MAARVPKSHHAPMLDWLRQVVEHGGLCPTNDQIADRFDYSSPSWGSQLLSDMEARGSISVERFQSSRVVTITETGKSTARPKNTAPHWRDRLKDVTPTEPSKIGEAPTVPIRTIAEDDASLADEIMSEAKRLHRPLTSFLSELVEKGWFTYLADQQECAG